MLEDGLGDTIRVSLTEDPEFEIPVALNLVNRYNNRHGHAPITKILENPINPFVHKRRTTREIANFGSANVPRVILDLSNASITQYSELKPTGHIYNERLDKFIMTDQGADYVYSGEKSIPFMLPNGLREIVNYDVWSKLNDVSARFPHIPIHQIGSIHRWSDELNIIEADAANLDLSSFTAIKDKSIVILLKTNNSHGLSEQRRFFMELINLGLDIPVVICRSYTEVKDEQLLLYSSTDIGGLLIDGIGDGCMIILNSVKSQRAEVIELLNRTSFGILQAARTRMTKTEYISCPSCGRTLFDLQETTAKIRARTDHLKGVKIGIMGCIVNGPGEMADADYGYVGSGKDKITLYRGMNVVKRNVPSGNAVDELIELIKEDGVWLETEPQQTA